MIGRPTLHFTVCLLPCQCARREHPTLRTHSIRAFAVSTSFDIMALPRLSLAILVVACVLAVPTHAATTVGTLGSGVAVAANTETTITYTGLSLVVHTTTASTVTLSSYASVVAAMPTGYSALGFSAEAGFTLAIEGGGELVKAELTTPSLTTTAAALITGSVEAGCLRYDVDARAYNKIDIDTYTAGTKTIKVQLPKAAGTVTVLGSVD